MEHEDQVGTTRRSGRPNRVVRGLLYAVTARPLTPAMAASQQAPQIETNPAEWDALISIWWDQPPYESPR